MKNVIVGERYIAVINRNPESSEAFSSNTYRDEVEVVQDKVKLGPRPGERFRRLSAKDWGWVSISRHTPDPATDRPIEDGKHVLVRVGRPVRLGQDDVRRIGNLYVIPRASIKVLASEAKAREKAQEEAREHSARIRAEVRAQMMAEREQQVAKTIRTWALASNVKMTPDQAMALVQYLRAHVMVNMDIDTTVLSRRVVAATQQV